MENINAGMSLVVALGKAVQEFRENYGLSLTDLCLNLGMSYEHYLEFEDGNNYFDINDLDAIANALNTTVSNLFSLADEIRFKI